MKPTGAFPTRFKFKQQSCTAYPIRDEHSTVRQICIAIQDVTEMAAYEKILLEINLKDSLTGAYNRRFLTTRLSEEFERHRRYSRTLSLLMLDIDYFKKINDTYGHQCGDFILKAMPSAWECMNSAATSDSPDTLLRMEDEALYKAKEAGRNRIVSI